MKLVKSRNRRRTEAQEESYKIRKTKIITFLSFIIAYLLLSIIFYVPIENLINGVSNIERDDVSIHFVDVGHGDATIIELPDNKKVLIDSGNKGDNLINYINHTFRSSIKFDYFIISHTDIDHIGNALTIMNKFDIDVLYRPMIATKNENFIDWKTTTSEEFSNVIQLAKSKNIELRTSKVGEKIVGDDYVMEFLSPNKLVYEEDNNYSPVIKFTYANKNILFCGDAGVEVEQEVLGRDIKADILKVGHHGSKSSSSVEFLSAVAPKYAVISCEVGVYSDVPSNAVLGRLETLGVQHVYRTDTHNSIIIGLDEEIKISTSDCADKVFIKYYYIIIVIIILAYGIIFQSTIGQKR